MTSQVTANVSASRHPSSRLKGAFTLIELLLSISILTILMLIVTNVIGVVQKTWVRANSKVSEFREARMAFDLLARNLSQATLNAYWQNDFEDLGKDLVGQQRTRAKSYFRQSELQFVCGKTPGLIGGGNGDNYPGHGVFFQAPLGVTNFVPATGTETVGGPAHTENLVNLLCGRGYYVAWGDDKPFRPAFLNEMATIKPRWRYRLMEYSPTAERNQIYYDSQHPGSLAERDPISKRSKLWFQNDIKDSLTQVKANEDASNRGFFRPVAENVICLVIAPQVEAKSTAQSQPVSYIAPKYEYDSVSAENPAVNSAKNPQGTQHLLPPLIKLTMIVVDTAAGERLAEEANASLRNTIATALGSSFITAQDYKQDIALLESLLITNKLNFRIFTTTVILKQARWSGST